MAAREPPEDEPSARAHRRRFLASDRRLVGLLLGPILLAWTVAAEPRFGLSASAWRAAGLVGWMATWWVSEAVPLAVTALLPIVLRPVLGLGSVTDAAAPFANPIVFLFLGGFLLALGLERWDLHRWLAGRTLERVGTRAGTVVGVVMGLAALLSMWVSNTATVLMLLPMVTSMAGVDDTGDGSQRANVQCCLLLGLAYGASIGGLGTLIGTPPNALLAAFLADTYGLQISFARWMLVGVPLVVLGLPLTWWVLTQVVYPVGGEELPGRGTLASVPQIGPPQRRTAAVFLATVAAWLALPFLQAHGWLTAWSDAAVALVGGGALFVVPSGLDDGEQLMAWSTTRELPWGILILFGGGLSLAEAIASSGLAGAIAGGFQTLAGVPILLVVLALSVTVLSLTELTSNTATAATFLPIAAPVAVGLGYHPILLAAPVALATSAAFMLPVATPPNALVFGSGRLRVDEMARAGVLVNLLFLSLITVAAFTIVPWGLGIDLGAGPLTP